MTTMEKINAAADGIRAACGEAEIGMILGSGLAESISLENEKKIAYQEIPNFPVSTVPGHKSEWVSGTLHGKRICMMRGRFHMYEGWTMEQIAMPIRVMKRLGVKALIVTNAAGGVNTGFALGDLMLITDTINFSGLNPLIGANLYEFGPRFPDMSREFDADFIAVARSVAAAQGLTLREVRRDALIVAGRIERVEIEHDPAAG